MERNRTNWKPIACIIFLMIIIAVLVGILLMTKGVVKNKYIISVLVGVTSSLIAWLVIFIVLNKYFISLNEKIDVKVDNLGSCFKTHEKTTQTILQVLQGKFMTLIQYDRSQLLGKGFYDDLYKEADSIKISGITLTHSIKAMCKDNRSEQNLLNQLLNRKNVSVKMLLLHPESDLVKILDFQESSNMDTNPVKKQIIDVINLLEKFSEKDEGLLQKGSKIEIALTFESMNSIITYAGKQGNPEEDILLMGLLFGHKRGGPFYRIPNMKNNKLYSDCIRFFDNLFKNARKSIIFAWSDEKTKTFNKNILKSSK